MNALLRSCIVAIVAVLGTSAFGSERATHPARDTSPASDNTSRLAEIARVHTSSQCAQRLRRPSEPFRSEPSEFTFSVVSSLERPGLTELRRPASLG
jgi:hypothetical protein